MKQYRMRTNYLILAKRLNKLSLIEKEQRENYLTYYLLVMIVEQGLVILERIVLHLNGIDLLKNNSLSLAKECWKNTVLYKPCKIWLMIN